MKKHRINVHEINKETLRVIAWEHCLRARFGSVAQIVC